MKKILLFGLLAAVLPAVAEEVADRKTATSLKYVTHELDTRQDKFTAEANKAMEYTDSAGTVQKRAVTSDLGTSTSDTSLPMVGGVNTKLNQKQDDIAAVNDHTAVTYTGQPGGIGQKGIYQTTESYAAQSDNLIDAKTFNAALKNGLDSEFKCREDNRDPVSGLCWLYTIHNNTEYVSATGTVTQDGTPTPENSIYPVFYHQGNMILRRVGDYADSYDATTHKITRRVGVKVLDGTEQWERVNDNYSGISAFVFYINTTGNGIENTISLCTIATGAVNNWSASQNKIVIRSNRNIGFLNPSNMTYSSTVEDWGAYVADQYAAGTPVTVYYQLATPVEEDWDAETVYIPQNQN